MLLIAADGRGLILDLNMFHKNPGTLILKLEGRASTFVSDRVIGDRYGSVEDLVIDARPWYARNAPLITEADFLYERDTRPFIGLTFAIHHPEWELPRLFPMLEGLDPDAVRITDYSDPVIAAAYPKTCRAVPYLEVVWHPSKDYAYDCSQELYGAWAFAYPVPNPSLFKDPLPWTRPCGVVVADVSKHLQPSGLRFPERLLHSKTFCITEHHG